MLVLGWEGNWRNFEQRSDLVEKVGSALRTIVIVKGLFGVADGMRRLVVVDTRLFVIDWGLFIVVHGFGMKRRLFVVSWFLIMARSLVVVIVILLL